MKQIIIDYQEYLKLQKCYDIVNKKRFNVSYEYDETTHQKIMYIQDSELLELFELLEGKADKIIIT